MSTDRAELPGEDEERGWRDRFAQVSASGRALLATRLAILQEELAGKAILAARGIAVAVVAAALGIGALLLVAALLAALFAKLFGSVILGILAAVVLYAAGAAGAAFYCWKALSGVRPFEFPATGRELSSDFEAIGAVFDAGSEDEESGEAEPSDEPVDDLEERFRAGSE